MIDDVQGRRVVVYRLSDELVRERLGLPGPVLDARVDHFGGAMLELVVVDPRVEPLPEGADPWVAQHNDEKGGF